MRSFLRPHEVQTFVRWINQQHSFHPRAIINAWYIAVQLYALFNVLRFLHYQTFNNPCFAKITASVSDPGYFRRDQRFLPSLLSACLLRLRPQPPGNVD